MKSIAKYVIAVETAILIVLFLLLLMRNQPQFVLADGNEIAVEDKKIAITFDDGPHPLYTPVLLDGLQERNVKATFFVIGKNVQENPELVKRMQEEGHLIGNHTFSHMQLTAGNLSCFREEIMQTNELIRNLTGQEPLLVRPPYGEWDKSLEKDLNVLPVLWTVDPYDWRKTDVTEIVKAVLEKVKEDDIILLHDCYASSVEAALCIVDILKEQGFRFVTVDEILLD